MSHDEAVVAISEQAWLLYHDFPEYYLKGERRIPGQARPVIARWILFLHSDLPYEWPVRRLTGPGTLIRDLRGWLTSGRSVQEERAKFEALGDYDVWPFFRREDFDRAKTEPEC